jgi:FixJ family two-component response regulator
MAMRLGAAEFLVKPFVREVLLHNIERILAAR